MRYKNTLKKIILITSTSFLLAGCGDELGRPKDQIELSKRIIELPSLYKRSENGRQQAQYDAEHEKLVQEVESLLKNRKVIDWVCSADSYAGSVNLRSETVSFHCTGRGKASITKNRLDEKIRLTMTQAVASGLSAKTDKIYENDKIKFSGVITRHYINSPRNTNTLELFVDVVRAELLK